VNVDDVSQLTSTFDCWRLRSSRVWAQCISSAVQPVSRRSSSSRVVLLVRASTTDLQPVYTRTRTHAVTSLRVV